MKILIIIAVICLIVIFLIGRKGYKDARKADLDNRIDDLKKKRYISPKKEKL